MLGVITILTMFVVCSYGTYLGFFCDDPTPEDPSKPEETS